MLARRPGQWVHIDQIVDALYSDDPTGGPLTARNVIAQRLTQLRPLLRAAGVAVEARWGGRGERDSYRRLVRVAP